MTKEIGKTILFLYLCFVISDILVNNLYVGLSLENHNSSLHKITLESFIFVKRFVIID